PMAGAPPEGTGEVTDLSSCTGIRFYARGDGKTYHVKIPYSATDGSSMTGYNDYKYDFTADAAWTLVDIPFTLLSQATGWGTAYPIATVLANAKEVQFQTSFNATALEGTTTADLWIDDLIIYGCAVCPTPPPTGNTATPTNTVPAGATSTFTHTATNTNTIPGPTATFTNTVAVLGIDTVALVPGTGTITIPSVSTVTVNFNITGQNATSTLIELVDGTGTAVATLYNSSTILTPGAQSINVSTSGITGIPDGNYTVRVTVMNSGLGQMAMASSASRSWSLTPVGPTATNTNTHTATHTYTNTNTYTATVTNTPTGPTATPTATDIPGNITVSNVSVPSIIEQIPLSPVTVTFTIGVESAQQIQVMLVPFGSSDPIGVYTSTDEMEIGLRQVVIPADWFATIPTGLYTFVVKVTNTESGNTDYAGSNMAALNHAGIPTLTPTPAVTPDSDLEIPDDKPFFSYPNPADTTRDVNIKFFITKNAKTVTFKMYTSSSRLVKNLEVPASDINRGFRSLTAGDNIITVPAEYFKSLSNGTYYYVIMVKDDAGKEARSTVDKIIIVK
ncbi:MAG: CIA30 family protein, partial [Spirochaetes bacterium]|nr:CIA30 family protein [Spirochaetota bacterium]